MHNIQEVEGEGEGAGWKDFYEKDDTEAEF